MLGVSDQTIARRYRRLCADVGLKVVAVRDGERFGQDQWMLRLRCTPDSAEAIASALARRPDTAWIALASGGTEVICMTRPRSDGERDELMLGKLPRTPRIVEIRAYQMLHTFFGGSTAGSEVRRAQPGAGRRAPPEAVAARRPRPHHTGGRAPPPGPGAGRPRHLPRTPTGHWTVGVGGQTQARRTARLARAVHRRRVPAGAHRLPVGTTLWITAAPAALHSVGEAIARHPEAAFVSASAGPSNLVATVLTRSTAELYAYLSGRLGTLDGVQHIETTAKLRRIKQLSLPAPTR